jgi:hypothetical protein
MSRDTFDKLFDTDEMTKRERVEAMVDAVGELTNPNWRSP